MGKASRMKGARAEVELRNRLAGLGVQAEKLSVSGLEGPDVLVAGHLVGEIKRRATNYPAALMAQHLDGNDLLFWRLDHGRWHVTMDLDTLAELLD